MRRTRGDSGVILIALLWILMALSVIALSFSREGFVEVAAARNTRDLTDGYYVARGGIAKTVYPAVTLLGASDSSTVERAWIALGTHTVSLLTLELLGKPALSVQSMGPRRDGIGLAYALNF